MDCHFLLQEIFLTQGLNPGFLHGRQFLYQLCYQGSPFWRKTLGNCDSFSSLVFFFFLYSKNSLFHGFLQFGYDMLRCRFYFVFFCLSCFVFSEFSKSVVYWLSLIWGNYQSLLIYIFCFFLYCFLYYSHSALFFSC